MISVLWTSRSYLRADFRRLAPYPCGSLPSVCVGFRPSKKKNRKRNKVCGQPANVTSRTGYIWLIEWISRICFTFHSVVWSQNSL